MPRKKKDPNAPKVEEPSAQLKLVSPAVEALPPIVVEPPSKHAKYGGSKMELTIKCSASVGAMAALPKRASSDAAMRGTKIHDWLQKYLTGDFYAKDSAAASGDDLTHARIAAKAGLKIKEVLWRFGMKAHEGRIEEFFALKQVNENCGGIPDWAGVVPFRHVVIVDYKSGFKFVDAEESWQMRTYALAYLESLPLFIAMSITEVHMIIVQSEMAEPWECRVQVYTESVESLRGASFLTIKTAVNEAETNPQFRAGTWCEELYCDARSTCAAHQQFKNGQSFGLLGAVIENNAVRLQEGWTLVQLLEAADRCEPLFKKAKEDAENQIRAKAGSVQGYDLVSGVGHRKYDNEAEVPIKAAEAGIPPSEIYETSLISPAQFQLLLETRELEVAKYMPATTKPTTKAKLVKVKEEANTIYQQITQGAANLT